MNTPPSITDSFGGLGPKQLKSLATKLKKAKANYKISEIISEAVGAEATPPDVVRHLVAAGHLDPMPNGALLSYLAHVAIDAHLAVVIAEALARRDEAGAGLAVRSSGLDWMGAWPAELDEAVYPAYGVAPAAFVERAARYAANTRRGLAFVARRRNEVVDPALVEEVLVELARGQATGYGISGNSSCPFVGDDGVEVAHRVDGLPGLRVLALRVGPAERWDRALVEAARRNEWGLIENVADALVRLPLDELTRLFATRTRRIFGDSSDAEEHVAAIMDRRDDTPEALLAPLAHAPESDWDAKQLREVYTAAAERKRAR